jgi:hypothetical protein
MTDYGMRRSRLETIGRAQLRRAALGALMSRANWRLHATQQRTYSIASSDCRDEDGEVKTVLRTDPLNYERYSGYQGEFGP